MEPRPNSAEDFFKLLDKKEDLHPDLAAYVDELDSGMKALRHPLLYSVPYTEQMNAMHNEQYKVRQEIVKKAVEEKNWGSVLAFYERPYRFQTFLQYFTEIPEEERWELFGWLWTDSENIWQAIEAIEFLLKTKSPHKEKMMDEEEREFLKSLPNEFTVYRGYDYDNLNSYSWTLNAWVAHKFAHRYHRNGKVAIATCKKEDVIAVMLGRQEFEIVVDPDNFKMKAYRAPRRTGLFAFAYKVATQNFQLNKKSYHGPWHWDQVERNVILLCKKIPTADLTVCRLFAILHDCKRLDENKDPEHGIRAANLARMLHEKNDLSISKEQFSLLEIAIRDHNSGETSNDPTIGVCWDADRLDLLRVGDIPDPKFFSTKAGKEAIWNT